jgi:hypothetical protein
MEKNRVDNRVSRVVGNEKRESQLMVRFRGFGGILARPMLGRGGLESQYVGWKRVYPDGPASSMDETV